MAAAGREASLNRRLFTPMSPLLHRRSGYAGQTMTAVTLRFKSLWILAVVAPVLAGIGALIIENAIHTPGGCKASGTGGAGYDLVFLGLALAPGALVGLVGWRSKRVAADTVGPFALTMCLGIFLVFIGLAAAWGGSGCMT